MQAGRLVVLAGVILLLTACKQEADQTAVGNTAVDPMQESVNGTAAGARDARTGADAPAPAQGGAFARQPSFQLPAPVSSTPVQATAASSSRQIDVAGVTDAVLKGLDGTGSTVQVA